MKLFNPHVYAANIDHDQQMRLCIKQKLIKSKARTHARRICTHEIMRYTTKSIKYICICIVLTSLRWLTTKTRN